METNDTQQMIRDGVVVSSPYRVHDSDDASQTLSPGHAIPVEAWLRRKAAGESLEGIGLVLYGDSDPTPIKDTLSDIPFVALHFPKFTDGRAYSHARRLRSQWAYKGTLLACGDVLRDQLVYMQRCGINAFHMRADQDLQESLRAFQLFTELYQYNSDPFGNIA